jgi:V/A-type H+-transporting ATPase subunit E
MALQDVKNDILREARDEASDIEEEGRQEAQKIIKEAEEKAEKIKKEAREELEDEKENERQKVVSNARMKARQEKLKAKQKKIGEAFQKFGEKIRNLDGAEKKDFVDNAVDEAEFEVGKIQASKEFEDAVDERKVDFEEADIEGFILVSENGERSKNFSYDKILQDFRDQYRKDVAEKLFGEVAE